MKPNLIKLHSSRAKFGINFSIIGIIIMLYVGFSIGPKALLTWDTPSSLILIILIPLLAISFIWYYIHAFLCFLDTNNNVIIFKKPFLKKEWIIKLEDIQAIDTIRFPIISRAKHIKVSFKNKHGKISNYYMWKSSSFIGLGGNDDKILFEAVLKRKKELLNTPSN